MLKKNKDYGFIIVLIFFLMSRIMPFFSIKTLPLLTLFIFNIKIKFYTND